MQILIAKTQHSPMCQLLYFDVKLLIILNCFLIILSWSYMCDAGSLKFWHSVCFFGVKYVNILFKLLMFYRNAIPDSLCQPIFYQVTPRCLTERYTIDLQRTTCRHDTLFESSNVVIVTFNLPSFCCLSCKIYMLPLIFHE